MPDSTHETPHDLSAERAVVGCMLLSDDNAIIADLAAVIPPSDIHDPTLRRVYREILLMHSEGTPAKGIDVVTVSSRLNGDWRAIGLAVEEVPHTAHATYYANIVRDMAERRRLIEECKKQIASANDPSKPLETDGRPRGPSPVVTCFADVEPREIDWLWPGRIPAGRITLLVGKPGEGKSFLTTDLAARVSTGTPWPDGSPCARGSVVLISAEDDPRDTIRPRLDAHYADASRVHLLSAVRRRTAEGSLRDTIFTLADVEALERTIAGVPNCRLVIIDPIGSYLGGGTDAHRDNEVRSVLAPVAQLAERYGAAVLVVAHRRKGTGGSADDSALGSRAFTGIARAVWHLSKDRIDKARRLLLAGKINIAEEGTGLAFSIVPNPGRIVWERDAVDMSADDALASESESNEGLSEAESWLRNYLAAGPVLAKDGTSDAKKDGISERKLRTARERLCEAFKDGFQGPWKWKLKSTAPKDDAKDAKDDREQSSGIFGAFESSGGIFDDPTGEWE